MIASSTEVVSPRSPVGDGCPTLFCVSQATAPSSELSFKLPPAVKKLPLLLDTIFPFFFFFLIRTTPQILSRANTKLAEHLLNTSQQVIHPVLNHNGKSIIPLDVLR